ncbi:MAG TPA: transglutaminase-like domain-containing protein [Candidatus Acidoferrales bacterium]|nr:transglutaminase-like domain-containing protein [Candidatus Acidoferrales bacterium]
MNFRRRIFLASAIVVTMLATVVISSSRLVAPATREFEFTYHARIPQIPADAKTVRVWIPLPRPDGYQTISELNVQSPLKFTERREPLYGNQYLYLEAKPAQLNQPFETQIEFRVARREHRVSLEPRPGPAEREDPAKLRRWLEPDRLVPVDGLIAALAKQATEGKTTPLEKARGIYEYVVATMRYDKTGTGWGRGDAIFACTAKRGNCTDFHSAFIGMLRSVGIPARFEMGFPLPEDKAEGGIPGYHCWAEFYVEPYGWIPVDASEAWKNPSKHDYFFGAHDVNRVLFTFGRDIRLVPPEQGDPLNYFIYPYVEVDGKAYSAVESKFTFRDLEAKAR